MINAVMLRKLMTNVFEVVNQRMRNFGILFVSHCLRGVVDEDSNRKCSMSSFDLADSFTLEELQKSQVDVFE